jgi:hypothetical protein
MRATRRSTALLITLASACANPDHSADRPAILHQYATIKAAHFQPNGTTTPVELESAFLDIWHKKGGEWRITTHANTQHDGA